VPDRTIAPSKARFNKLVMSPILRSLPTSHPSQDYLFGSRVHHVVNDLNLGLPDISGIWVSH
jgi:peptide/nickel transport system substrate-binding protein